MSVAATDSAPFAMVRRTVRRIGADDLGIYDALGLGQLLIECGAGYGDRSGADLVVILFTPLQSVMRTGPVSKPYFTSSPVRDGARLG